MDKGYHSLKAMREQKTYFDTKNMEQKQSRLALSALKDKDIQ